METKPTIYCVQSGIGKTYFCQHNPGWVDIDTEFLWRNRIFSAQTLTAFIDSYIRSGYKILLSGDPSNLHTIVPLNRYNIILIRATQDMKDELLARVKSRPESQQWAREYDFMYNGWMQDFDQWQIKQIYIKPGQYLSDILGDNNG